MKYGKLELKRRLKDVLRKPWTDTWIIDLIDSLWRDEWTNRTSGFEVAGGTDAVIAFDRDTRTFSIEPLQKKYAFYQYTYRVAYFKRREKETVEIPDQEGLYMVYFDHDPQDPDLQQKLFAVLNPTADQIDQVYQSRVIVAWIYWDQDLKGALYFGDSRHGSQWSPPVHWWLHQTLNSQRQQGMAVTGINPEGDGSQESDVQYGITPGKIWHCDFMKEMPGVQVNEALPVLYFEPGGNPRFLVQPESKHYNTGSGRLAYNTAGVIAEASQGAWVNYHLYATHCMIHPYMVVMGQAQHESYAGAMGSAQAEVIALKDRIPHVNLLYLGTIIYETRDEFSNSAKARIVSFHDEVGVTDVYAQNHPQYPVELLKYRKKGLDYPVTQIAKPHGLVQGGQVTRVSDLEFSVGAAAYYMAGVLFETASENVTLNPSDSTDPRIDIVVVNDQGEIQIIKGIPAVNPQKPTPDPATQIELTEILVPGLSDQPDMAVITQPSHGFIVGSAIRHNGTHYVMAQADNDVHAQACGVVSAVIDGNQFRYISDGFLPGNWIPGAEYFLSPYQAGKLIILSDPEVWEMGQVRLSMGFGTSKGLKVEIDVGDVIEDLPTVRLVGIWDREFEFCFNAGYEEVFVPDRWAVYAYEILEAILECDQGSVDGVSIRIDGVPVGGLENLTVGTMARTYATGNNKVLEGAKVTLHIPASFTGSPSVIAGKLKILRS